SPSRPRFPGSPSSWKAPASQPPISPLVGEMPGRAEGGAVPPTYPLVTPPRKRTSPKPLPPPSPKKPNPVSPRAPCRRPGLRLASARNPKRISTSSPRRRLR
ncbi:hypothetical protein EN759_40685, partial [Mesorhizobium sp. M00.F.Ca.ET.038.03.1.1]